MYIDISSNQGKIDFELLKENKDLNGIILRGTTKNNNLDKTTKSNYENILKFMPDIKEISIYKFSYARTYAQARIECAKCLKALADSFIFFDYFYLDLEGHSGRDYTTEEANEVILGYYDEIRLQNDISKFRLYFNYNYLKNIIDKHWSFIPLWLARYNSFMGVAAPWNVVLWQYTSKGLLPGISVNVDMNKEIV